MNAACYDYFSFYSVVRLAGPVHVGMPGRSIALGKVSDRGLPLLLASGLGDSVTWSVRYSLFSHSCMRVA